MHPLLASASAVMPEIPLWLSTPFALLLALIATMPLSPAPVKHFWEKRYPWIAIGLGLTIVLHYLFRIPHGTYYVLHTLREYTSFICLIGSLFVISGGIQLKMRREATPLGNVGFLAVGGVLANLIGTTGASMVLIRPWIKMNKYRITAFHIVFFIFVVSNVGGCLTPVGDPPLYLGYLRGVPFFWITQHAFLPWLATLVLILGIFFVLDRRNFARAPLPVREKETAGGQGREPFFQGWFNLGLLGVVIAAVLVTVYLPSAYEHYFIRELIMVGAAALSYFKTPRDAHQANDFSFGPIKEVAFLFIGIFTTMMPALGYLEQHGREFGLTKPIQYYFASGGLSSVLDNAPTYVNFLKLEEVSIVPESTRTNPASGELKSERELIAWLLVNAPAYILAISLGSVFFGAMTYIGNGPNFMVKSIAESAGIRVPSFFGYIFRFSIPYLLPVLILVGFLFL